jgi:16S rRNA processing protein RimM
MSPAPDRTSERARRPAHNLLVGRVVRPHGVRGDLLVQSLSEILDSVLPGASIFVGGRSKPISLVSLRRHGRAYLMHLEGCASREAAESYRGEEVRVRLEETAPLAPGRYYYWQIIGLRVVTDQGETLGVVRQILETGANDVYIVGSDTGKDILLPAISSVIRKIDLEKGEMVVRLLPGLVEG